MLTIRLEDIDAFFDQAIANEERLEKIEALLARFAATPAPVGKARLALVEEARLLLENWREVEE